MQRPATVSIVVQPLRSLVLAADEAFVAVIQRSRHFGGCLRASFAQLGS